MVTTNMTMLHNVIPAKLGHVRRVIDADVSKFAREYRRGCTTASASRMSTCASLSRVRSSVHGDLNGDGTGRTESTLAVCWTTEGAMWGALAEVSIATGIRKGCATVWLARKWREFRLLGDDGDCTSVSVRVYAGGGS
jgi:cobalamin synthase